MWGNIARVATRPLTIGLLVIAAAFSGGLFIASPSMAAPGVNQEMNFQGRLFNAQGAVVPDGYYNIEFKIYQDGTGQAAGNPGGTLKWTETYLNANSDGILVKNGFMSVQLGSLNPFGTQVDWNQDTLWLSMNIAGTNAACAPLASCAPDGEMVPMKRLSSNPYAMNSGRLGGLTSGEFLQLAQGVQTDVSTNTSSIFINKTGSGGDFMTLQSAGTDALTLTGSGDITFGANANHTLSVATATTAGEAGKSLTVSGGNANATGAAATGGDLILQGGNAAGTGNANGGDIVLSGGAGTGTGADGLVILTTPTFSTTTNDPNCYTGGALVTSSCTVALASVNGSAAILIGFSTDGQTATLPAPTNTTAGRVIYIAAANASKDFTLQVNGGGTGNQVAMRQNTSATMIWNGSAWTAAGASSSTTLQAAYDNTLQSAGGAELVVSKTTATNGLTIRDSSTNPVNGAVLSIQSSSAASLLSVNSNVKEYASDAGAETSGSGGPSTFPSSTWSAVNGATVTRHVTAGDYIATGQGSVSIVTPATANSGTSNTLTSTLTANTHYNVSFTSRLASGTLTDLSVYYSSDGTSASVPCATDMAVNTSVWTKINCTFTTPAAGISSGNAILIRQAGAAAHTLYVDNLSVTIAADYNYATDGSVSNAANFSTNWTAAGGSTVARTISVGNDASDSAMVTTTGLGQGVRNKLAVNPLPSTLYRITVYAAASTAGFDTFTIQYSGDGGTTLTPCVDYNTREASSSLGDFTKVTCYVTTSSTASTDPYVYFTQGDGVARTFYVDTFAMNLSTNTTPNVQIGGGIHGGPATLLTLDKAASAPIAGNNDALLGSMYYDTTLGKLQCYEADGWGACGSSPDSVVTISPEYNNAVLHGTGIGTMVSDICSDTLNINDGSSGQSTICGTNETFNFYRWTSPQASAQTYSIYVTYQLPSNFKSFASGKTSIMGRTDSSSATVEYQVYRSDPTSGMTPCGSAVPVSSGSVSTWQTGTASGTADPSTCSFAAGNSIVFKINATASQNASAYIGNLNFTFNNQ